MSRLTLDVAKAALAHPELDPLISVSRSTELYADLAALGKALVPVDTFASGAGALTQSWRIPLLRRWIRRSVA